jgi:hypothetical protein
MCIFCSLWATHMHFDAIHICTYSETKIWIFISTYRPLLSIFCQQANHIHEICLRAFSHAHCRVCRPNTSSVGTLPPINYAIARREIPVPIFWLAHIILYIPLESLMNHPREYIICAPVETIIYQFDHVTLFNVSRQFHTVPASQHHEHGPRPVSVKGTRI